MHREYQNAIAIFSLFVILLVLSGVMIFIEKIGLSVEDIMVYYLGSEEKFIQAKSFQGLLKIVLPHTFAYGLLSMVLLHFLIFTDQRNLRRSKILVFVIFSSAFLEIVSPFLLLRGLEFFAYLKLGSFIVFNLSLLYVSYLLAKSILDSSK